MLWSIAIILALLWAIGLLSHATFGGFIHLFIVVAILLLSVRIIQGALNRRHTRHT